MQDDNTYTERKLLARLAGGDEVAFTQLFHQYKDKLYSFILHLSGSAEVAEDVLQDVFLKIWHHRLQSTAIENFGAYLFRMAQNHMLNSLRRQSKAELIMAELIKDTEQATGIDAADILSAKEVKTALQNALDTLPAQRRRIFEMSRNQGLKYQEIADELGISVSTVRNQIISALKTIREYILQHYPLGVIYCILLSIPQ